MTIYVVTYTVGFDSGYSELVGIYSSVDKANTMKQLDMKQKCRNEWHYSVTPIEVDKTINKTYKEW